MVPHPGKISSLGILKDWARLPPDSMGELDDAIVCHHNIIAAAAKRHGIALPHDFFNEQRRQIECRPFSSKKNCDRSPGKAKVRIKFYRSRAGGAMSQRSLRTALRCSHPRSVDALTHTAGERSGAHMRVKFIDPHHAMGQSGADLQTEGWNGR